MWMVKWVDAGVFDWLSNAISTAFRFRAAIICATLGTNLYLAG